MIGVDEVGRGCLAGPLLVVAARQTTKLPTGLKDSKLLSKKQREELFNKLSDCCEFGEGWVSSVEIDRIGLGKALKLGVSRALDKIHAELDEEIVIDGSVNYVPRKFLYSKALVKADNLVPIVSASSIYAKVTRDNFMTKLAVAHPEYSFDKHVGYGTKAHMLAIQMHGILEGVHRTSFAQIGRAASL
jgi:ribonuclease HII